MQTFYIINVFFSPLHFSDVLWQSELQTSLFLPTSLNPYVAIISETFILPLFYFLWVKYLEMGLILFKGLPDLAAGCLL